MMRTNYIYDKAAYLMFYKLILRLEHKIYKIFGAMAKDSYCEINEYFAIPTSKLLIVMIDTSVDIGVNKIMYAKH